MKKYPVVFFFGAGASAFCGECIPHPNAIRYLQSVSSKPISAKDFPRNPPLGKNLFTEMDRLGLIPPSIPKDMYPVFIDENEPFEKGMMQLNNKGSQYYNPFLKNMALYLSSFLPSANNFYANLLRTISKNLENCLFSTIIGLTRI